MFDHDVDLVTIFHLEAVWSVVVLDPLSVEYEAALVVGEALPLAVGVHEFLELGGPLDLEVDFGSILRLNLDVDMLVLASCTSGGVCILVLS